MTPTNVRLFHGCYHGGGGARTRSALEELHANVGHFGDPQEKGVWMGYCEAGTKQGK